MGRSKIVSDQILIQMIDDYFYKCCDGNSNKLKLPDISRYVAQHGYPDYRVTTLRRNALARDHIDALKQNAKSTQLSLLVSYKTLNVTDFLDSHPSRASLIAAISSLDDYYRNVAETAVKFNMEYQDLSQQLNDMRAALTNAEKTIEELRLENAQLTAESTQLRGIIQQYVYPGIAQALLVQEGILPQEDSAISPDAMEKHKITAATNIVQLFEPVATEASSSSRLLYESKVLNDMLQPFNKD